MTKLDEPNDQFVLDWQKSLLPVEVSVSALINAAVTIARTQAKCPELPRNYRNDFPAASPMAAPIPSPRGGRRRKDGAA